MELTNVRVEYTNKMTVNIGNFQNLQPGYTISADIPDGVNPTEAANKLKAIADGWLEAQVAEIQREMNG